MLPESPCGSVIWNSPATSLVKDHAPWQKLTSSPDQCRPTASSRIHLWINLPGLRLLLQPLFEASCVESLLVKVSLIMYRFKSLKDEHGTRFIHYFPTGILGQSSLESLYVVLEYMPISLGLLHLWYT
jgi:hypothetical protein